MFLRRHRKHAGGETYDYWSLVKTVRTACGPRHQVIARLGKLDGAQVAAAHAWQDVDALLAGHAPLNELAGLHAAIHNQHESARGWASNPPPPVVSGASFVVTNAISGEQRFYRLKK